MTSPIIFSEARHHDIETPSARDNTAMTDAAKLAGFRVYYIPSNFEECENAENALWQVPEQDEDTPAVWVGFIPSPERYEEVYEAAARRRIFLINSPEQHQIALEFDRSYPLLGDLTPQTVIIDTPDDWRSAGTTIGYPAFVRGSVRSRKDAGWNACVAETPQELQAHVELLFQWPFKSRGRVLVRRLAHLRYTRHAPNGFPMGREYRVFLLHNKVIGFGYYWEGDDPLAELKPTEETEVRTLAEEVAKRVGVPFVIVDIGQETSGTWTVIEVGDAQFAGAGQTPMLALWQNLYRALTANWRYNEDL